MMSTLQNLLVLVKNLARDEHIMMEQYMLPFLLPGNASGIFFTTLNNRRVAAKLHRIAVVVPTAKDCDELNIIELYCFVFD